METITFITNSGLTGPTHVDFIKDGIKDADEIILCVAYWKTNGIEQIRKPLIDALKRGICVKFYVSLNEWNTRPDALVELYTLTQQFSKASLVICKKTASIFHTKIYYFRSGKTFSAVIGSANLTLGGLEGNDEVSVKITSTIDTTFHTNLKKYLTSLDKQRMVQPTSVETINTYTLEFNKKNNKRIKYGLLSTQDIQIEIDPASPE